MFSSLASFLFGSNTSNPTPSETTATTPIVSGVENINDAINSVDAENLIEVTSLTPSVTGSSAEAASNRAIKRGGKNRRNNNRQQNRRKGVKNNQQEKSGQATGPIAASKQTTPSESSGEDFDEDEWYIVEKEDDNDVSPARNDTEVETITPTVIEIVQSAKPTIAPSSLAQQRRLQHINSHSLYSGPRPQKQRNNLHKSRNNNNSNSNTRGSGGLSVSTLSPSRTVNDGRNASGPAAGLTADGGMTRSLYVAAPPAAAVQEKVADHAASVAEMNPKKMEESWFVTPPPCFTSIGPINMKTSPYENLLIEHPSMSVYHSIKTFQEAADSFIELDFSVKEPPKAKSPAKKNVPNKNSSEAVQLRTASSDLPLGCQTFQEAAESFDKLDLGVKKPKEKKQTRKPRRVCSALAQLQDAAIAYNLDLEQLKKDFLPSAVQKTQSQHERKDIRRSAIIRSNKAREVQSKNHTARRSDQQHCKIISGANNNRKSCF